MFEFIAFVGSAAATVVGYVQARSFTAEKLRYVDAVHRMSVPILAGVGAACSPLWGGRGAGETQPATSNAAASAVAPLDNRSRSAKNLACWFFSIPLQPGDRLDVEG